MGRNIHTYRPGGGDASDRRRGSNRRAFLLRSAGAAASMPLASLLAGCGESGGGATTGRGKPGGTLRIATNEEIGSLDPASIVSTLDLAVAQSVLQGLQTWRRGTFESVDELAESIESSSDGTRVRFVLKEGIPFQGGYGEVTAEDVKFSFERIAGLTRPKLESAYAGDWLTLERVDVESPTAGVIVLREPFAPLFRTTLPLTSGAVVPRRAVERLGKRFATEPVGSGAYQIASYEPKRQITLRRFADYGGASSQAYTPFFDEIVLMTIADRNAMDAALQTGDVDYAIVGDTVVGKYEGRDEFRVDRRTNLGYTWIGMNRDHPNLQDVRVRQAVRLAVDVPGILAAAYDNRTTRATAIIPESMGIGYWEDAPVIEQDLDAARALLAEAGASELALTITHETLEPFTTIAQIVQANLAEVGIDATVRPQDTGTWYGLEPAELQQRQVFVAGYSSNPDPYWSMQWFTADQVGIWNWMGWADEEFDRLNAQAIVETDDARRGELYVQMQQRWHEDANAVWIEWPTYWWAGAEAIQPALRPDGLFTPRAFAKS